jgi:hypothetical protein
MTFTLGSTFVVSLYSQVCAHCPFQGTKSTLPEPSSAHSDVPAALRYICCFILPHMRLLSHIPQFPAHYTLTSSPLSFPTPAQPAFLRARLVRSVVCESQWVLAVHSVLWASRRELTCSSIPSSFLYNPKWWQAVTLKNRA